MNTKLNQLSDNFSDLKQALTKSQSDLTHTLRETRMYMFKDIRKACEDAGLDREQWLAVEAELQAQFDRLFEEDKDESSFYDDDDEDESLAAVFASLFFEIIYKLTLYMLVSLSDYIGLEASLGAVSAFSLSDEGINSSKNYKMGAQVRSSLIFGFSESHSWGFGLNFVKNPSEILNQHLSFLSTHRFYVNKYFFCDFVWVYVCYWFDDPLQTDESVQLGWSFGGDVGYNIIQGKKHWLSLVIGFQHIPRDDMAEKDELSLNLVYTFRGYFEE